MASSSALCGFIGAGGGEGGGHHRGDFGLALAVAFMEWFRWGQLTGEGRATR